MDIPPGLESLLPRFLAEMAKDTRRLCELAGGDAGELAEHAHAMRGKCAMFGESVAADLLAAVEGQAGLAERHILDALISNVVDRMAHLGVYNEGIGRAG